MLNRYKFIILLIIISHSVIAQVNNDALGKIKYDFKTAIVKAETDTSNAPTYQVTSYQLLFGQNSSMYSLISKNASVLHFSKDVDTSTLFKNKIAKDLVYKEINRVVPTYTKNRETTYLKRYTSDILTRQEITTEYEKYLITDTLPKIDWRIFEEKKTILNYTCQKAVGKFRGRSYIAWFAIELPMPTGPWKLNGLPGIILAANDDKNEIFFDAINIEIPIYNITLPNKLDGNIVTANQFISKNTNSITKTNEKDDAMIKAAGHTVIRKIGSKSVLIELTKN
jgi:GLPGLI family protein